MKQNHLVLCIQIYEVVSLRFR